jgi:formamidopyrimidine-DNA glycosylase
MPELPEVETVKRGLAPFMEGKILRRFETRRAGLRYPFPQGLARLEGQQIIRLSRRAKYLLIECETETLVAHLGMSGSFRIEEKETLGHFHHARARNPIHDHVVLHFDAGQVIYNDPRRFGFMDFLNEETFKNTGVEPLGNEFNAQMLFSGLQQRKTPLKTALLDQNLVAGLGNIYVCEALFLAKISPLRASHNVTLHEVENLTIAIKQVLERAIQAGGSSLQDHAQVSGDLGYFQHSFRVYEQTGAPCHTCALPIQRLKQAGRSTFFCEGCQI